MMNEEQIRNMALEVLGKIAPNADLAHLDPKERLRDQFDFDSVDFMNFAVALQKRLTIVISEADYPQLATLNGCVAYLLGKCNP
jgi:acyl carrier protein